MPKSLPKWATRVLAVILLAATYAVHAAGLIPPGLTFLHINVLGAVNDAVIALAAAGISGPSLWPQLAAILGNPSAGMINDAAKAVGAPVPSAKAGGAA